MTVAPITLSSDSERQLAQLRERHGAALALEHLVAAGMDHLPLPGSGHTLARWRALAAVAAHDLSLVKLFEGHTDALAIQAELGAARPPSGSRWGTWCAEAPNARLMMRPDGAGRVRLEGTKAWCSGAGMLTHAVVSVWDTAGQPCLATVALDQRGVVVTGEGWQAVGMAATRSVAVRFEAAHAVALGAPGAYVGRAGFWHGAAGIGACWWGGACGIARTVNDLCGPTPDPHRLAHLGAIAAAISATAALARETAGWIDAHPQDNAQARALCLRLAVEAAATEILARAGRALGAGPLCQQAGFARAMADLPVFLRQSHAERDLAAMGALVRHTSEPLWTL